MGRACPHSVEVVPARPALALSPVKLAGVVAGTAAAIGRARGSCILGVGSILNVCSRGQVAACGAAARARWCLTWRARHVTRPGTVPGARTVPQHTERQPPGAFVVMQTVCGSPQSCLRWQWNRPLLRTHGCKGSKLPVWSARRTQKAKRCSYMHTPVLKRTPSFFATRGPAPQRSQYPSFFCKRLLTIDCLLFYSAAFT